MITDLNWRKSFESSELIEEINVLGDRIFFTKSSQSIDNFNYPFRMFVFSQDSSTPCLILSLEIGLRFGTCALGAHTQTKHVNYGPADPNMSYDDFKSWALSTAELDCSPKM